MPLRQNYLSLLSRLLPAGAVGVSILLGSAAVGTANEHPAAAQPGAAKDRVSERLAAIRDAVSAVALPDEGATDPNRQLAWGNWWRNGGWYRPWGGWGWPNWHNWRNGWHNWRNWWPNW